MKKCISFLFCLILGGVILASPVAVKASCHASLTLCVSTLIPSLFPFMLLSNFIIKSAILPPSPFLLGLVGGYPIGAEAICTLFREGLISKEDAERTLPLCSLCGPGFIFGVIPLIFSTPFALILWCTHISSALLLTRLPKFSAKLSPCGFSTAFCHSVKASLSSILNVCAFVLTVGLICDLLPLPTFAFGILELSRGVVSLSCTRADMVLSAFFVSFGGLCVHGQVAAICHSVGLSPYIHFKKKLLHGVITAFIVLLLTFFII